MTTPKKQENLPVILDEPAVEEPKKDKEMEEAIALAMVEQMKIQSDALTKTFDEIMIGPKGDKNV